MHNTRRVLALPGRRHRTRCAGPDPSAPPGLELSRSTVDVLLGLGPYYPATLAGPSSACPGCGRESGAGETVWWPDNHQHTPSPLCYECGVGLHFFAHGVRPGEVHAVGPFAGGLPAFPAPGA